jgi:hypothetical protein
VQAILQAAALGETVLLSPRSRTGAKVEALLLRKQLPQRTGRRNNAGQTYFSRRVRGRDRYASELPQSGQRNWLENMVHTPKSYWQAQTKWLTNYSKEPRMSPFARARTCKSAFVHAKVQRG